jgi:hypothetical protein
MEPIDLLFIMRGGALMNRLSLEIQRDAEILNACKFQRALTALLEADVYANRAKCDRWEFAVSLEQLQRFGLTENDIRFLVRIGYLEHARELFDSQCDVRQFQFDFRLNFRHRTCFVLSHAGVAAASQHLAVFSGEGGDSNPLVRISRATRPSVATAHPIWDFQRRILSFDGKVVKHFRLPADNQEVVLTAFQEEDWPVRIFDPLSPADSVVVKRRLSETIKALNRRQQNPLVHFRGDGTGEGVMWEVAM